MHIYLTFLPELECNAATALAELEIFHPAQLAADRRTTPLFMDNQARPITGIEADKWILKALAAVKSTAKYSMALFQSCPGLLTVGIQCLSFRNSKKCRHYADGNQKPP